MGPHEMLRVRGGRPFFGGPALEEDELFAEEPSVDEPSMDDLPEEDEFSYTTNIREIKERIIHAGQPRLPGEPKIVLRPLPQSPLQNETPSTHLQTTSAPQEEGNDHPCPSTGGEYYSPPSEGCSTGRGGPSEANFIATFPKTVMPSPVMPSQSFDPEAYQVCANGVTKSYLMGKVVVPVLKGVNLGICEGEFLAIVGQSGSGKSTLLHLLGTLDSPDQGTIHFDGQRIDNITSGQRDLLRNRFIGMIFQFYHLLPELSVLENVLSPLMVRDSVWNYLRNRSRYHKKGRELLDAVGLSHRLKHKPNELSGGEMQRAAIARALISEPQILLADEPTGNLDAQSAQEILQLLRQLNKERNLTIVMVTHDLTIAREADRMISIYDGRVR